MYNVMESVASKNVIIETCVPLPPSNGGLVPQKSERTKIYLVVNQKVNAYMNFIYTD